jgi:hypothetical protein
MYGIFTYIWVIFRGHVGKYSIHGAYGYVCDMLVIPLLIYVLTMALLGLSFFEGKRAKSLGLQSFVSIQFKCIHQRYLRPAQT